MSHVLAITLNPALDLSIGVDQLVPGTLHRARNAATVAAGKGHNVACVLAALGHDVTVAGFLGDENDGAHARLFAAHGLVDRCTRIAGATRTNVKIGEADGRVSDVNTPGAIVNDTDWQAFMATLDDALAQAPAAVVLAGSLAPGIAPARIGDIVQRCHTYEVPVWLDTSGAALAAGVAAGCAWVKPNACELAEWAGVALADEAELLTAAHDMQAAGGAHVIVSRGGERLYACHAGQLWVVTPPRVAVANTVCAGDSLLAGLLHGQLSGQATDEALRFACALAAEAVRHVGVGRADAPDFSDLQAQVCLETTPHGAVATAREPSP
ncbi:1-phosphofructokinase family hexose kinase [Salinisphaera japonica]|uniref:Phosphofructokinase n=1 Tax=Salinisphaera japonica YTM-1 TaxID=1209778 RepID=A0A423PYP7_9GAMM|nr:1-phosphofructokinase family hexose kinase [Salinisphaera japonica]ROO30660.1 1-phosphofructokinase [Salinisphaera japonica YTM-1]